MTPGTQLPRRSLRPSDAALREAEAERLRPLAARRADQRFTGRLLLLLAGFQLATAVYLVAVPGTPEISPWVTGASSLLVCSVLYLLAFRGFRFAWWLIWAFAAAEAAGVVLQLSYLFDVPPDIRIDTLLIDLAVLGLVLWLLLSPRVRAYRRDLREKRTFG